MDKELLFKRKASEATREVPIADIGIVLVRALSQGEVSRAKDDKDYESALLADALLDPELTQDEARQWLDTAPAGDTVSVMDAIAELSGLKEGAQKSGVPGVRGQRRR